MKPIRTTLMIFLGVMFFGSMVFSQESPDPASAAKTLNLRLVVNSGGKVKNGTKIAVLPFIHTNGQFSEFSVYFASEMVSAMFKFKTVQPVERAHVEAILDEIALGATGLIDDSSAAHAGKLRGAEALLIGEMAEMSGTLVINARIVSSTTGEVLSSANIKLKMDPDIERMMKNVKGELSGKRNENADDQSKSEKRSNTPKKALAAGDWHGFHIELLDCVRNGNGVEFEFIVTNNLESIRELAIRRSESVAYDENGGEYTGSERTWTESVPSGISVKTKIKVDSVKPDLKKFKLFEFTVCDAKSKATLPIRNIPISEAD